MAWHLDQLSKAHPAFLPIIEQTKDIPIRWLDPGFKGLIWVVTGQRISVAAGRAIYMRLEQALGNITAETLASVTDDTIRAAGFSINKTMTLRAIQHAVTAKMLNFDELHNADAQSAIDSLCAIKGIGLWTAEVYLLFAAGHPDIFPSGDVALQEAVRLAFSINERPNQKQVKAIAETWSPWRSSAARLLWCYYLAKKNRQWTPS